MTWPCCEGRDPADRKVFRACTSLERKLATALHRALGRTARRGGTGAFLWDMRFALRCTDKQGAKLRALALRWADRLPEDLVAQVRAGAFEQRALIEAFDKSTDPTARERIGRRAVELDQRMGGGTR